MSLTEAIIAVFILVGAFLVVIALFHSGLRYTTQAISQQVAVVVAEKKLEEIRAWAQTPTGTGFNYDDWTPWQNLSVADADYPDYNVTVNVIQQSLYSPSLSFESQYAPVGDVRAMRSSAKKVQVTVSWNEGQKKIALVTYVGEPLRTYNATLTIQRDPSAPPTLAHDASVQYNVTAFDDKNVQIQDVLVYWCILPGLSNGSLAQSRDGSTANLTNRVYLGPLQPVIYTGGAVTVQARALYGGNATVQNVTQALQ